MSESVVVDYAVRHVEKAVKFSLPEHLVILCYSGSLTAKVKKAMADSISKLVDQHYEDNTHSLPFAEVTPGIVGDGWISSKIQNFTIERWTRELTDEGKQVNLQAEPEFRVPESVSYVSLQGNGWGASGYREEEVIVKDIQI